MTDTIVRVTVPPADPQIIRTRERLDPQQVTVRIHEGPAGPQGDPGPQGDTGPQGEPGQSAGQASSYAHTQNVPASTWVIAHGLGFHPAVTVTDSAGTVVEGDVLYLDVNTVSISFAAPFGGSAYLS